MSNKLQTDLSKFNNSWFKMGAGPVKLYLWYIFKELFINSAFPVNRFRLAVLRMFGARIGRGVIIKPHVVIKFPWNLSVGDNAWIGEKVWIENQAFVTVGNNVCLSQGVMIMTGNHDYSKTTFDLMIGPVTLEDGAWLGAGSEVCPNTTVGSHAVLTMGSVASGKLEPYGIYRGNLAVKVKERVIRS